MNSKRLLMKLPRSLRKSKQLLKNKTSIQKLVPFSRFIVADYSMTPLFLPKDRVITLNWSKIEPKDVVVFKNGENFFIKRIIKIQNGIFFVTGDNKKQSLVVSKVKREQIVGKVIGKY